MYGAKMTSGIMADDGCARQQQGQQQGQ